ncbi:unnamed protein product [Meloidogyne enterolobii]|uniref:Uncharacterized protein n=1 Tax=Meloidogyne enterolobii TaxID=390850 RepID=A0ACB0Y2Y7_MELEN
MSLSKSEKPAKITIVSQEQLSPSNSNGNDLEANKSASSGLGEDGIKPNGHLDNLQAEAEEGIDNVVEDHRPPSGDSGISSSDSFTPMLPLDLRQINLFGFNYPLQCTNYVNEYLSAQLNNHENDIFNGQKVYEHPNEFIRDAKKFFNVANRILTCECCWGAFSLAVKLLFKDLKINFTTHNAGFKLAFLGARFSIEGPFLGSVITLMNRDHQNFYSGVASRDDVFEFIDNVKEFAYYFGLINANDVWNYLKNYLPKEPGDTSFHRGITFEKKNKFTDGIFGRIFEFEYTASIPKVW